MTSIILHSHFYFQHLPTFLQIFPLHHTSSRFLALAVPSCFVGGVGLWSGRKTGVWSTRSADIFGHATRISWGRPRYVEDDMGMHLFRFLTRTQPSNNSCLEKIPMTNTLKATNYQSAGLWNINQQCIYKYSCSFECWLSRSTTFHHSTPLSTCEANVQASDTR